MWQGVRAAALDELEAAHRKVGGTSPGRRYATQQLNQAYAVLLSSQFQGFCRDLHSEAVDQIVRAASVAPPIAAVLRDQFITGRKLDRGNPNPGNIGSDFSRLGLAFWNDVDSLHQRNAARRSGIERLNVWRNAIAHNDFDPQALGGSTVLHLKTVQVWRGCCDGLARSFDVALGRYLGTLLGSAPW